MAAYLLDANILSPILKRNDDGEKLKARILDILRRNDHILLSPLVFYEINRGLYQIGAANQIAFFKKLAGYFEWRDLTKNTWDMGAKLWADCRKIGQPTGEGLDKDVLIAAQAMEIGATVVTRNTVHFKNLKVAHETW